MKALTILCCALALASATTAIAQTPQSVPTASNQQRVDTTKGWAAKPADIGFRPVDFYSEGVRLSGQLIYASANEGKRLPVIVTATGWGGQANSFRSQAVEFARAGYAVFLFDYRGWGGSDGRLVLSGPPSLPAEIGASTAFETRVQELREYVDPWEQTTDWFNAISFVSAQPWADPDRIGVRGASFSGGFVVYVAAHDQRVKAVVSLIGAFDGAPENWVVDAGRGEDVRRARDERDAQLAIGNASAFPPPRQRTFSGLQGSVPGSKLTRWDAADAADRVVAPTLFVLADQEELFDNSVHGVRACNSVRGPRKMIIIPNAHHYDVYGIENDLATKASIDWFDRYLLPPNSSTRAQREQLSLPGDQSRGSCASEFVRTPGSVRGAGDGAGYRGPPRP